MPNFRREIIRSKALRAAARDMPCTLVFAGCNNDWFTTVLCHVHDESFGMGQKADDTSGVHGCSSCHAALDLGHHGLSPLELAQTLLRAYQRTIRNLVLADEMKIKHDPPPKAKTTKPRKPKEDRAPIRSNKTIHSRPSQRKSK